ncbi:MAG: hypothetical protein HZA15_12920 [Nitrospirae bacterium]|nr:hypothetical protein [Nitrospirota bacterium]
MRQSIEADIQGILSAINLVLRVSADTIGARAMMDGLLKGLESRYYFAH